MPDVIRVEWKIYDRGVERMGVNLITVFADGSRKSEQVRLDGNATHAALWGVIESVHATNRILGYTEKFWEQPGFNDIPKRKK